MRTKRIIAHEEYQRIFLDFLPQCNQSRAPMRCAWEKTESEMCRRFGRPRYRNYSSFRSANAQRRRLARCQQRRPLLTTCFKSEQVLI
jgi:hypothetical protein